MVGVWGWLLVSGWILVCMQWDGVLWMCGGTVHWVVIAVQRTRVSNAEASAALTG